MITSHSTSFRRARMNLVTLLAVFAFFYGSVEIVKKTSPEPGDGWEKDCKFRRTNWRTCILTDWRTDGLTNGRKVGSISNQICFTMLKIRGKYFQEIRQIFYEKKKCRSQIEKGRIEFANTFLEPEGNSEENVNVQINV